MTILSPDLGSRCAECKVMIHTGRSYDRLDGVVPQANIGFMELYIPNLETGEKEYYTLDFQKCKHTTC